MPRIRISRTSRPRSIPVYIIIYVHLYAMFSGSAIFTCYKPMCRIYTHAVKVFFFSFYRHPSTIGPFRLARVSTIGARADRRPADRYFVRPFRRGEEFETRRREFVFFIIFQFLHCGRRFIRINVKTPCGCNGTVFRHAALDLTANIESDESQGLRNVSNWVGTRMNTILYYDYDANAAKVR